MTVPAPMLDPADILLGLDESLPAQEHQPDEVVEPEPSSPPPKAPRPERKRRKPDLAALPPLTSDDPPLWRRHLHWLLVLAMIPLATSLLVHRDESDLVERLAETLRSCPPDVQARFESAAESGAPLDDLIDILPEHRLRGAWLSRTSYAHWGMAAAATILFLVFFMFLASDGSASPQHVLLVGLFTATIGVGLLLLIQGIASLTEGRLVVGNIVLMIVYSLFRFIAFSYSAAADPDTGFFLSFIGFTLGVGLLEELIKSLPLFRHREESQGKAWRGLFIWGLASGAGFGIAEGILYSSRYYNGLTGPGIYFVRFVSCVALHAIWTGSVAITIYLRRDLFANLEKWRDGIGPVLVVIGIPMILHGLYDTSLKRDMNWLAMIVAAASFGWLAFLSSRLYGTDDVEANRAMLAEYQRRKKALT